MPDNSGKQVLELLRSGDAVLSEDQKNIVHRQTREVLAYRIARNAEGRGFYQAPESEMSADCVKVCLSWEWDEKLKISVCAEFGCQEEEDKDKH